MTLLSVDELSSGAQSDRKSLLELIENQNAQNPFIQLKSKGARDVLMTKIEELPENNAWFCLYYYEDLNLKEIGRILSVTESGVSLTTHAGSRKAEK